MLTRALSIVRSKRRQPVPVEDRNPLTPEPEQPSTSSSSAASSSPPSPAPINHGERVYLELMDKILQHGSIEYNRTGTVAKTLFGEMLRFDLTDDQLPLLTTKQVSYSNVLHELLWFISGSTNLQDLERRGVHIWRANATPEYLKRVGLHQRYDAFEDLGPIYSHQWRYFGASYIDCHTNYKGKGVDQLKEVLRLLRHDRQSRRIILTSWNPTQLNECVLPPCHCMAQFRVLNGNQLHCHMTQRSADYALGVPYNIASYAMLTHILAKLSGLKARELVISFGDVHIYKPHWDAAAVQLQRAPYSPPKIVVALPDYNPNVPLDIDTITFSSVKVLNYKYHSALNFDLCP